MTLRPLSTRQLLALHLWPGLAIVGLFALLAPIAASAGIPTFAVILAIEVLFLAPFVYWKLSRAARDEGLGTSPLAALGFSGAARWRSYLWLVPLGLVLAIAAFELLRPLDEALRSVINPWLPDWHYSKDMLRYGPEVLLPLFVVALIADGLIGPAAEELYFRGYLLARMQHLRLWAPVLNGVLFAIYHFWQPMNYPSLTAASLVLAGLCWWRRDYRLALLVHCVMNSLGHTLGLLSLL